MVYNSYPYSADSSGLPVLLGALRVDQPDLEDPAEDQLNPPRPCYQATKWSIWIAARHLKLTGFKMSIKDSVKNRNLRLKQFKWRNIWWKTKIWKRKEIWITLREHLPDSHIPEDIIEENGKVKRQIIILTGKANATR